HQSASEVDPGMWKWRGCLQVVKSVHVKPVRVGEPTNSCIRAGQPGMRRVTGVARCGFFELGNRLAGVARGDEDRAPQRENRLLACPGPLRCLKVTERIREAMHCRTSACSLQELARGPKPGFRERAGAIQRIVVSKEARLEQQDVNAIFLGRL